MNALDVMKYGHLTVLGAVDGLQDVDWTTPGACGVWSIRDIMFHLASYELVLADVLGAVAEGKSTPRLDDYLAAGDAFNDAEVNRRQGQSAAWGLAEYRSAYESVADLAGQVPDDTWGKVGTLPWYGDAYSLDDWIVYQFYGHKREHCAQIDAFRDRLRISPDVTG